LRCVDIELGIAAPAALAPVPGTLASGDAVIEIRAPRDVAFEDIERMRGRLSLATADAAAARLFPATSERIGSRAVAALGMLSTLVGMVCPGLHSIFGGFAVDFVDGSAAMDLSFAAGELDDRFRSVVMNVSGGGIAGSVDAFARHAPVARAAASMVAARVEPGAFEGVSALVVGGSRGLGAATAQILVAGGARVAITYRTGRDEALELVAELGGDRCTALAYDTAGDARAQLASLAWMPNQVYYFATPHIFRELGDVYSRGRFHEICDVYVDGFERLVRAIAADANVAFFYPSSVAVVERPRKMTEYAMAKAAGEILCADLARASKKVRILSVRLPRVLTDQTATVMPVESASALEIMLPIARDMIALTRREGVHAGR
jgi:NAD(P)-dependent dehydrogenase (short-subunit alcohol dehydrogenase family)